MMEIDFLQEERPITVWKPIPKEQNRKLIAGLAAVGILVLLGICLLWGWWWAIAAGLVMAAAVLGINYRMQKKITMERGYFYLDRGELYFISPARKDKKLNAFLQEASGSQKMADPDLLPNAFLASMAEHSVICHISVVNNLVIKSKKNQYSLSFSYELIPYPYNNGFMTVPLKSNYENFDSLIQLMKDKAIKVKYA